MNELFARPETQNPIQTNQGWLKQAQIENPLNFNETGSHKSYQMYLFRNVFSLEFAFAPFQNSKLIFKVKRTAMSLYSSSRFWHLDLDLDMILVGSI